MGSRVPQLGPWIKYYAIVNAASFLLFAADKIRAKIGWYRISEKDLCIVSLLGGWPVGFATMICFKHKWKKKTFLIKFCFAVAANLFITYYVQRK